VDPKSAVLAVHHLEHLMRESACFASVLTRRDEPRLQCSPYMLFEYGLALRAKRPHVVFAERGVSGKAFASDDMVLWFDRNRLDDQRTDFVDAMRTLADRARPYRNVSARPSGKVGLLFDTGPESPYRTALLERLKEAIDFFGYDAEPVSLEFHRAHELARKFDDYDFVCIDVGRWGPAP
jgi:hypothetical protein